MFNLDSQFLETILQLSNIGLFVWDLQSNSIQQNFEFKKIYGFNNPQNEILENQTFNSLLDYCYNEDISNLQKKIDFALQTGKFHYIWRISSPQLQDIIKYVEARANLYIQGDNKYLIGILYDRTSDKFIENTYNEQKEKLNLALLTSKISLWNWDIEKDLILWDNNSDVFFDIKKENLPTSFADFVKFIHPEDRSNFKKLIRQTSQTNTLLEINYRILKPDKTIQYLITRAQTFELSTGKKLVGSCIDNTKHIEEHRKLQNINKQLESFAYVVSHDLQEPLRAISSYTELLAKKYQYKLDEKADRYIYYILDGASRMNDFIQGLLQYLKLGQDGIDFKEADLGEMVSIAIQNLSVSLQNLDYNLEIRNSLKLCVNKVLFIQIFQNLINNSVKFRKKDESLKIIIDIEKDSENWLISIKDNGIGFNNSHAKNIFKLFKRLHSRSEYDGTGLGLSFVKRIVEIHNGEIWAESIENIGTSIYIKIPRKII